MKRHPAIDVLEALSSSFNPVHRVEVGQGYTRNEFVCPSCQSTWDENTEDDPKIHKPTCVLVQARLFIGRVRAAEATQVKLNADDVLVSLGNMSEATETTLELDPDYEGMVEDYIADFNQMVSQGQTPMKAFFAMAQAYAIVWGCCIRAGLKRDVGHRIITMILKNCDAASKSVRIVTTQ